MEAWRASGDWELLKHILPNHCAASEELAALLLRSAKEKKLESETDSKVAEFTTPLTDDERARRRFLRSWKPRGKWERFGPRWGPAMALAWHVAPPDVQKKINQLFSDLGIWQYVSADRMRETLKSLSNLAKKHGNLLFRGWWKWLVNWETLGGYLPSADISEFTDELREWVTGDVIHEMPDEDGLMSESTFLTNLEAGMKDFLSYAPNVEKANDRAPTIDEYVRYPGNWARPGASGRREAVYYEDENGVRRKARKSKWRTALALPTAQVASILRESNPNALVQKNKAVQKRESGKVRAVVNADDETYLRMAYISQWLEVALDGHPKSTLYMSTKQLTDLWEQLARGTENDTVKIPLDQAHFDWQQNKRMLRVFFSVIRDFIQVHASQRVVRDLLSVLRSLEIGLVDEDGLLVVGEGSKLERIRITKGIMSGWRWTAMMDTIFNWGELYCARKLVRDSGFTEPVLSAFAQGDDDQVTCPTYGHAAAISIAYDAMNFEINPSKFFVDTARDEFLRQVAVSGDVSGYPVRAILSLLWRNPAGREPVIGVIRMGEQLKGWNLLIGRGAHAPAVFPLMLKDMSQGNGLTKAETIEILSTPTSVGGLGYWKQESVWRAFTPGSKISKARIDVTTIKGLDQERADWLQLGVELGDVDVTESIRDNLEMDMSKTEIIPGTTAIVQPLHTFMWHPSRGGGVPLKARGRPELPVTMNDFVLRKMIRNKEWDWIRNVWLDPNLSYISKTIEQRGGRRVWIDWLIGKLPWHIPNLVGWSDLKISVEYKAWAKGCWSRVVGMQRFSYTTVLRAALSAEAWTRQSASSWPVHIGG